MKQQLRIFAFYTAVFYLSACFQEATFNIGLMNEKVRTGTAIGWLVSVLLHAFGLAIFSDNNKKNNHE